MMGKKKGRFAVTVGLKGGTELIKMAKSWAETLAIPYLKRPRGVSLETLRKERNLVGLLVATRKGPQVETEEGILYYHPSMATLRVRALKEGKTDHLVEALALRPGSRVLDGTLGLASDAAVISYAVGSEGTVVGVEASPILYQMTRLGLRSYDEGDEDLLKALRRIEPVLGDTAAYLESLPPDSFDAVYFDPMFEHPVEGSSNMVPMRPAADHRPLTLSVIEVRRDGDNRLRDLFAQIGFGGFLHLRQNHSGNVLRGVGLAVNVDFVVGAHVALDGSDGALRIGDGLALCDLADQTLAGLGEADDRRGGAGAFGVRDDDRLAAFHNGDAAVGSTKVNANNLTHNNFLLYEFLYLQIYMLPDPRRRVLFNLRPLPLRIERLYRRP